MFRPDTASGCSVRRRFQTFALDGVTMGRVLIGGFGAIFILWIVTASDMVRRLVDVEHRVTVLTTQFTEGEQLLFSVRTQVLTGSVYVRDAFLDPRPDAAVFYRDQLETTRQEIEQALQHYVPDVDSDVEREHWTQLQAELAEYWNSMMPVLRRDVIPDFATVQAVFRQDVLPRRDTIIRISEEIHRLHQDALHQQRAEVARLHGAMRGRVLWTSVTMVALGIGIAILAIRYARRSEQRIRLQHDTELQHKHLLQRLSTKLVRAQEEERRIIARDLHDEIGQVLMALKLELAAADGPPQSSDAGRRSLQEARSMTDRALQTIRDLSHLLHPAMLDDFGLPPTLNWHLRQFSERTGVRTQLVVEGIDGRLGSEYELCAYRVVQEALTNVAKHARATSCRVYVQRLPYSLVITVEDDGRGMQTGDTEKVDTSRGLGLISVRERVSELGGTYRLESGVGKGTRLTVELPVPAGPGSLSGAETQVASVRPDGESGELGGAQAASLAR